MWQLLLLLLHHLPSHSDMSIVYPPVCFHLCFSSARLYGPVSRIFPWRAGGGGQGVSCCYQSLVGPIGPPPHFCTALHPGIVSLLCPESPNARAEYGGAAGVPGPHGVRSHMWDRTYKSAHHAKSRTGVQSKGSIIHICERIHAACVVLGADKALSLSPLASIMVQACCQGACIA